ncbi:MAG TPA: hypothetical protein GX745_01245 [Clostridiales bacterium]|nr:hypothetical protein [Clostridiales bacterium]
MNNCNNVREIRKLKETNDKLNKLILEDAKDLFNEYFEQPAIDEITQDLEYIMPLAEEFDNISQDAHKSKNKNKTIFRELILEFVLTLFFGFLAIPAIFKKEKIYAIALLVINTLALITFFQFGVWHLLMLSSFLYLLELSWSLSRIIVFLRGKNYFKKFNSNFEQEENYSFTEL